MFRQRNWLLHSPSHQWYLSSREQRVRRIGSEFRNTAMSVDSPLNTIGELYDRPELGLLGFILELSDPVLGISPVGMCDELLAID